MGLGASQPTAVKECPRHYGIAASEIWSQWRHGGKDQKKPVKDQVHGHKMAVGQITWLVRKGDVILPDKPIKMVQPVTCAFKDDYLGGSSTARITFCATTMNEAPTTLDQLPQASNELPVLEVKLDDLPSACRQKRSSYTKALMDVEIRVGYNDGKGVQVRVLCDGREKAELNRPSQNSSVYCSFNAHSGRDPVSVPSSFPSSILMEAWHLKSTPDDLLSYPVAALNVTTKRWRLQPFPANLVGIKGYWDRENATKDWPNETIVYPCGDSLCEWPQPCEDFSCAITIEGIRKTKVGPAHSDIVGLTHGIIILLILLITTTLIMGCHHSVPSRPPSRDGHRHVPESDRPRPAEEAIGLDSRLPRQQLRHPRPSTIKHDSSINKYYTALQRQLTQRPVEISWDVTTKQYSGPGSSSRDTQRHWEEEARQKGRQIERCMTLLREMYALDLQAWSMEDVALREGDREVRVRLWGRVERIFLEVADVVTSWRNESTRDIPGLGYWSDEERRVIEAIYKTVQEHLEGRHLGVFEDDEEHGVPNSWPKD
ncbi:hypothetical protein CEP54_011655 [Fusarium duplospermum]|uniref:Uncharacterized protein n=1 Tax=Fusarium duplospermum TaxID=1325734 RepID=A0A428PDB1_9HYPO|nr:hypothetical protein CEP54_011655 [Fusarium duplospermum]